MNPFRIFIKFGHQVVGVNSAFEGIFTCLSWLHGSSDWSTAISSAEQPMNENPERVFQPRE